MAASECFTISAADDLEVTEIYGALLRELLEEFKIDGTEGERVECNGVPLLEIGDGPKTQAENGFMKESVLVHNFSWTDEIIETSPVVLSGKATGWYMEDMAGLFEFDFNDAATDEMGYSCLWDYIGACVHEYFKWIKALAGRIHQQGIHSDGQGCRISNSRMLKHETFRETD